MTVREGIIFATDNAAAPSPAKQNMKLSPEQEERVFRELKRQLALQESDPPAPEPTTPEEILLSRLD
jgi:hypothetical protein